MSFPASPRSTETPPAGCCIRSGVRNAAIDNLVVIAVSTCDLEDGAQASFEAVSNRLRRERHLHTQISAPRPGDSCSRVAVDVRCGTLVEDWE